MWDEIRITDEQLGKVTKLEASVQKASRQARTNIRTMQQAAFGIGNGPVPNDPEAQAAAREAHDQARQAERAAMSENSEVLKKDTETALRKILKPAQYTRIQQIDLQITGTTVIGRADVAKTLGLTHDQTAKIQSILNQLNQGQDQINTSRRDFFQSMRGNNGGGGGGRGNNNNNNMTDAEHRPSGSRCKPRWRSFRTTPQA